METLQFNPFEDRFSRDIRNDLSEAFVGAIESANRHKLDETATNYRAQKLDSCYTRYLDKRLALYETALLSIGPTVTDPISRAVILWDLELFFEVHEILEHGWYDAKGEYKMILQALIRAAGVYIKLECGFSQPARKIADKSLPVLEKNNEMLNAYMNTQLLISALTGLKEQPPKLAIK